MRSDKSSRRPGPCRRARRPRAAVRRRPGQVPQSDLGPVLPARRRRSVPDDRRPVLAVPRLQGTRRRRRPVPDPLERSRPTRPEQPSRPERPRLPLETDRRMSSTRRRDYPLELAAMLTGRRLGQRRTAVDLGSQEPRGLRQLRLRRRQALSGHPPWMIWGEPSRRRKLPAAEAEQPGRAADLRRISRSRPTAPSSRPDRRNIVIGGMTLNGGTLKPPQVVECMKLKNGRPPRMDLWGDNPFDARYPASRRRHRSGASAASTTSTPCTTKSPATTGAATARSLRLWISEWTIVSDRPLQLFSGFYVSRKAQAQRLKRRIHDRGTDALRRRHGLVHAAGRAPRRRAKQAGWGLLDAAGNPKPSFFAYKSTALAASSCGPLKLVVYAGKIVDAMREAWTDERLDDLNERVGELGRRMDNGFNQVRDEIRSLDLKIDSPRSALSTQRSTRRSAPSTPRSTRRSTPSTPRSTRRSVTSIHKIDSRTDSLRAEMKSEFLAVRGELASLHRLMVQLTGGVIVTIVATQIASRL